MSGTTKQLPRTQRQQTILRGAANAFAQGGYAATSMEDIAAATGITKLIVYRHFESKQDLYQAVLQRVSERLGEEFRAGMERGERDEAIVRSLLTVAREDADAFQLLFRHAARESQFAAYAHEYRQRAVQGAMARLQEAIGDTVLLRWAAETRVSLLVESVLRWLDHGDAGRDEEFVRMASGLLREMVRVWARS